MDLVLAFFSFLAQQPVLLGSINLLTLLSFGRDGTLFLAKILRREPAPDELFWSLFLGSGYHTLCAVLTEQGHISSIRAKLMKKKLTCQTTLSTDNLTTLFQCAPSKKEEIIRNYFSFFVKQIVQGLADLEILSPKELNSILQEAQEKVWTNWQSSLRNAYRCHPSLRGYVQEKKQEQVALLITGETIPLPVSGADTRFMHLSAPYYLKQEISTPDGQSWLAARPGGEPLDWWKSLFDQLDKGPLFLTGPGGMGKTSFLSALYQTIAQGELETKFSCALLLSLDTLMREPAPEIHRDIDPLADATQSVLLRRIARVTDTSGQEKGWKKVFLQKYPILFDQPVLLMLDGLNEMNGQAVQQNRDLYDQILKEINCLSNKEHYPNVRIVVTSRIDRENLLKSQLSCLPGFQHMVLGGVELPSELRTFLLEHSRITLSPTMYELLKRPMYCWAVKDMLDDGVLPSTQFQLLDQMYRRLCRQGENNMADQAQLPCLRYLMEYFVPILAYADWRGAPLKRNLIQDQYDNFLQWIPIIAHDNHTDDLNIKDQLRPIIQNPNLIARYLSETMQLLFSEDQDFSFCHQDYRDFLVAKYFLQRMKYMRQEPDSPLWLEEEFVNTLRLNTYNTSIMHLLYQAVSFSLPPNEGEHSRFVQQFRWDVDWKKTGLLAGHVLWYTTAYQLVDMRGLEDVPYGGKDLSTDALHIFGPLLSYVDFNTQLLPSTIHLSGRLLQNLIEVLMKCCELFRSQKNYQKARAITDAARHILSYNSDKFSMGNVVDYNESKVIFTQFLEHSTDDELGTALELLAHSTADHNAPLRYACNTLAMLLVSPHPKIRSHPVFLNFRQEYLQGRCPEVCAFWLYYDALFDSRKEDEDWQPRIYSLRQLLYLLSDYKVCVSSQIANHLENCSIEELKNLNRNCITPPHAGSPHLPIENILFIRRFLSEIQHVEGPNTQWKHYMKGLSALYYLPPDITGAKEELTKVGEKDVRAQMLLAFLDNDLEKLKQCYQSLRPIQHTFPEDIGKYCVWAYYGRDITKIYHDLLTQALPD